MTPVPQQPSSLRSQLPIRRTYSQNSCMMHQESQGSAEHGGFVHYTQTKLLTASLLILALPACGGGGSDGNVVPSTATQSTNLTPQSIATSTSSAMNVSYYGWLDNTPPGAAIAYPTLHKTAGGTGTFSDPITFGTSHLELKPGTKIYLPYLQKYFIMEDECGSTCASDWTNKKLYDIVLWIGGSANSGSALSTCENALEPVGGSSSVIMNPASTLPVIGQPLFNSTTKLCYLPVPKTTATAKPSATPSPTAKPATATAAVLLSASSTPSPTVKPTTTPTKAPTLSPSAAPISLSAWNSSLWIRSDGWSDGTGFNLGWRADHAVGVGPLLTLTIDNDSSACPSACSSKPYAGGELQSAATYGYGTFQTDMQTSNAPGTVSTFFTYIDPTQTGKNDEIDVEIPGARSTTLEATYYKAGGAGVEHTINLGFDSSKAFHTYGIQWLPNSISWIVDGKVLYTATGSPSTLPTIPPYFMINFWTGVPSWLGTFQYSAPIHVQYKNPDFIPAS